jgi:hypothetical protein
VKHILLIMRDLQSIISSFSTFGIGGSRSCPFMAGLATGFVACIPVGSAVFTGCASGVDSVVRAGASVRPLSLRVFSASDIRAISYSSALAIRTSTCVECTLSHQGLWCAFPSGHCPPSLRPSSSYRDCFCGSGSGTWASICYAIGLGCPCLLHFPLGVIAPDWFHRYFMRVEQGVYFFEGRELEPSLF